jgi:hypothetical protein
MLTIYLAFLVAFGAYGVYYAKLCRNFISSSDKLHPVIIVLTVILGLQLRRRLIPHFALYRRNRIPLFYGVSEIFLGPRKITL